MDELSADNQRFIDDVVASGRFETPQAAFNEAVRLLRDAESDASRSSSLTTEQWCERFEQWASDHRVVPHEADDRRESIYAGRGK